MTENCPNCGVEYDKKIEDGRNPTVEVDGPRRVCTKFRYDKHDYGYVVVYVHEPVTSENGGLEE